MIYHALLGAMNCAPTPILSKLTSMSATWYKATSLENIGYPPSGVLLAAEGAWCAGEGAYATFSWFAGAVYSMAIRVTPPGFLPR